MIKQHQQLLFPKVILTGAIAVLLSVTDNAWSNCNDEYMSCLNGCAAERSACEPECEYKKSVASACYTEIDVFCAEECLRYSGPDCYRNVCVPLYRACDNRKEEAEEYCESCREVQAECGQNCLDQWESCSG